MVSTRARTESTAFDTTGWLRESEGIPLHRSVNAEVLSVMSSETEEEHSISTICLELINMIQAD